MFMSEEPIAAEPDALHTVLVVEDEIMVRMPIAEFLRNSGYNVIEAGDAGEAMAAMYGGEPVSLVFSDVRMPGKMDGFGLAEWFQLHYPNVPVLLTSGYNGGRSLPVDGRRGVKFIEKPYSQSHVARRIAALLA